MTGKSDRPTGAEKSWRHFIPVHPAAQRMDRLKASELRALGEDIKARGLLLPVLLLQPAGNGKIILLDGQNRLDAMESVGIPTIDADGRLIVKSETMEAGRDFDARADVKVGTDHRRSMRS